MVVSKKIVWLLCLGTAVFAFLCRPGRVRAEGEYRNLGPVEARERIEQGSGNPDFVLLDVRTPGEFRSERIGGALLIDYNSRTFREEMAKLDRGKTYLVYCRTGNRSTGALEVMREEGFRNVYHLDGGIVKWKEAGLPTQK